MKTTAFTGLHAGRVILAVALGGAVALGSSAAAAQPEPQAPQAQQSQQAQPAPRDPSSRPEPSARAPSRQQSSTPRQAPDEDEVTDQELEDVIERAHEEDEQGETSEPPGESWFSPSPGSMDEATRNPPEGDRASPPPPPPEIRREMSERDGGDELPASAPTDEEVDQVIERALEEQQSAPDAQEPDESWLGATPEEPGTYPETDEPTRRQQDDATRRQQDEATRRPQDEEPPPPPRN
jgi:hypothetical protein